MSYGYSTEEVCTIIMEEFLKLKKVDWSAVKYTTRFHHIRSTYRVDAPTAEMILILDISVPNLHSADVCHYLLSVLEYNSLAFGISLMDSSSDSNDSGSGLQRRILNHSKRRIKSGALQPREKRSPKGLKCERGRKRVHKVEEHAEDEPGSKQEEEFDRLFLNRPSSLSLEFEDNLGKEYKKEI